MVLNEQAIGVFDSGVGGLSVLSHIHARLPDERLLYLADSAFMPYGCKSALVVKDRCLDIAAFFAEQQCKALVVACNTATAVAIHHLRARYNFPIVGMEPAVKPAVAHSRNGVVGILATHGTLGSGKFQRLKQRFAADAQLIVQACPGLVELIERGDLDSAVMGSMLQSFLQPLIQQRIDTLVLGCTHYPFVAPLIREIVGEHVSIVDSGDAIACELQRQLQQRQLLATGRALTDHASIKTDAVAFWCSGEARETAALMSRLWGGLISPNKLSF
ncbi:MAG: glutamate racemase [Mariprofundus sp.]|nr:glutamate racemase [Mariprofundus sp.]